VVGVTGASGAIYAQRFIRHAARAFEEVHLILSANAVDVALTELGVAIDRDRFSTRAWLGEEFDNVRLCDEKDYFTPPASGSFLHDGMVIVPCSMGTAGRIANGVSDNLMTRAADVCQKERRRLVLDPREMPMNVIMLRNLTTLAEAGAIVIPASPAWYHQPRTLEDLADTVVARILQNLGVEQRLFREWMRSE
jgi:4-hydroxy-3-polyprenylbenzoate decarboxylase